jgi:hypothetical protein
MSKLWGTNCDTSLNSESKNGASNSDKGIVKNILVHITGNRATWEHMGMHGALWRVNPDRAGSIFGCDPGGGDGNNNDKLSRAMIRSVKIIESNTNIDEIVGVQVDGLPPKEFTANGEGASCFLVGEGRVTQPQEIFNMTWNTELGLAWMKQYPLYTSHNLEIEGVMFLQGASYYFVRYDHPAIHMLKANEDQLGVQIIQEASISEGIWYKVDIEAFIYCAKSLRENVLQNTPSTFNLNNLTVRISKPDGQRWLQLGPQLVDTLVSDEIRETNDSELIAEARRQGVQRYIDKPLFVTLRMSIEYSLPDTNTSSGGGGSGSATTASSSAKNQVNVNNNNSVQIISTPTAKN